MKIYLIILPFILLNYVKFTSARDCRILCYGNICVDDSDRPSDSHCMSFFRCCKSPCATEGFSQSCIDKVDAKHPICMEYPKIKMNACCSDNCSEGVDVSHHNGAIDWTKVEQSGKVKFAMIKATQGEKFVDPNFVENWNGAMQNGITPNAYHYFIGNCSASLQLKNIQNTLKQVNFNLDSSILAIDVEPNYNQGIDPKVMADNLWNLMYLLEIAGFQNLFIYTNKEWNDIVKWQSYEFDRFPLWVASLLSDVNQRFAGLSQDKLPNGFSQWKLWQYTQKAQVPGFSGMVDMNRGFCTE